MASKHGYNIFSVLDTLVRQAFTDDVRTTSDGEDQNDENEDPTLASRWSQPGSSQASQDDEMLLSKCCVNAMS